MTIHEIYLCPRFLNRNVDVPDGNWGRIAGGAVRFSHVELIRRDSSEAKLLSYQDVATSREHQLTDGLALIEEPRSPMLGLKMDRPLIMGILNVTPDSFSDGGRYSTTDTAIAHGRAMLEAGADILDVGGESTRPGSDPVAETEEQERVLPVIGGLAGSGVLISCDTRKSSVMRKAVQAGASLINDISSLNHDPAARKTVAELKVPVVLMHSKGEPKLMQQEPSYRSVSLEVFDKLRADIAKCEAAGIPKSAIVADPGIGFGKSFDHNLELLNDLALFHGLGVPIMLGASRKAFIGAITGVKEAGDRVTGSVCAALCGLSAGVQIFRVHDVKETIGAFALWQGVASRGLG